MMCTRCEELEERVRQLEADLYNHDWESPVEIKLTRLEASIVATMVRSGRPCSESFLVQATRGRGSWASDPQSNLIASKISHIRDKFKPFGLEIETVWGVGYRLSPTSRARLLNWRHVEAA